MKGIALKNILLHMSYDDLLAEFQASTNYLNSEVDSLSIDERDSLWEFLERLEFCLSWRVRPINYDDDA